MKKLALVLAGLTIVSSSVFAQTNPVLSRNAVGYIKRTINSNELDFITVPFVNLSQANNTLSNVFPNPAPGSQAFRWDKGSQQYVFYATKGSPVATWSTAGSNIIYRGEGIFFRGPSNSNQTFYIMGEVPDRLTAPTTVVQVVAGVTFVGHGYPVDVTWTSLQISSLLPAGSQLAVWNKGSNAYTFYSKKGSSWGTGTNAIIRAGDGFYVRQDLGSPFGWSETKPYTWP